MMCVITREARQLVIFAHVLDIREKGLCSMFGVSVLPPKENGEDAAQHTVVCVSEMACLGMFPREKYSSRFRAELVLVTLF